jgi:hypothetical protein
MTGSATLSDALVVWAGVDPQQTQSGISTSSIPKAWQTARVERAKSQPVDSRLHPGKKEYFIVFSPPLQPA